jgi:hypothetical protein
MFHRCSCLNTNSRISRCLHAYFHDRFRRSSGERERDSMDHLASTMVSTNKRVITLLSVGKIPSESWPLSFN